MDIVRPPKEVFLTQDAPVSRAAQVMQQEITVFITNRIVLPPEGGIYREYKDCLYPEKALPFPETIWANNSVKRITLLFFTSLLPSKWWSPKAWLQGFILNYNRIAIQFLAPYRLQDNRYCIFCIELKKFIKIFLIEIGIDSVIATDFAGNIAHTLEYDDTYRYRIQDLFNEVDLKHPKKDILKMIRILKERDTNPEAIGKIRKFAKLISFGLWIPKIKRAFKKAVTETDIKKLQMDEADRYFCMLRSDYKYFGQTFEERNKEWHKIHPNGIPQQLTFKYP
jgi:hypothetical protein